MISGSANEILVSMSFVHVSCSSSARIRRYRGFMVVIWGKVLSVTMMRRMRMRYFLGTGRCASA